jgi:hypothetical protein
MRLQRFVAVVVVFLLARPVESRTRGIVHPVAPRSGVVIFVLQSEKEVMIEVADLATGATRSVARRPTESALAEPRLSPDGRRAVLLDRETNAIVTMELSSGQITKVASLIRTHPWAAPAWSPDGRFIVYSDEVAGENTSFGPNLDLFLVKVDERGSPASAPINITKSRDRMEYLPSWSSDSSRLAANVWIDGNEQQLFLLTLSGARDFVISSESLTGPLGKTYLGGGAATWSRTEPEIIVYSGQPATETTRYTLRWIEVASKRSGVLLAAGSSFHIRPVFSNRGRALFIDEDGATSRSSLSIVENPSAIIGSAATPLVTATSWTQTAEFPALTNFDWME